MIEDINDHFACLVVLKDQNQSIKGPKYIKTRNLDDQKIDNIVTSLQEHNWKEILSPLNANDGFNKLHSILITTIDRIVPEIEIRLSKSKTPRDPWITKGMLQSIQKQKKLYLEQLSDPTNSNKYKAYRNQLQKILRKAKHFSSIGETFVHKIPPPTKDVKEYLKVIPQNEQSIFLKPTNDTEIIELITDLIPKNSSGYDNLSNKLLKRLLPALVAPLTITFNKSLIEGIFPEAMKKADVVPLYKSEDHQESNNYRPISLLLILSKLLEKIMYKRTYSFLESSGQIYKSQYGFRTAHSCENAICELVSEIIKGKQDGMHTLAVF